MPPQLNGDGNGHGIDAPALMLMEISAELSALMMEYLDRGPTHTRTYIRDNLIVCLMDDTMTKAEHAIVDPGDLRKAAERRRTEGFTEAAVAIVERVTGRRPISFMSGHDLEADVVAHVFLLDGAEPWDERLHR